METDVKNQSPLFNFNNELIGGLPTAHRLHTGGGLGRS